MKRILGQPPSGVGKSRSINTFQQPFFKAQKIALSNIRAKIKTLESQAELNENDAELLKRLSSQKMYLFTTNATAEGLEATLTHTNGFFSAVSSEQGLFDSLLGLSYSSGANNNDVTLNGFDGGYVSSHRVKRLGYSGEVVGACVCFAQQGSIEKILETSNGTGLSERFLMLAEQHALGTRDHSKHAAYDPILDVDYAKRCEFAVDILENPRAVDDLNALLISDAGHQLIADYRNKIEPYLADGQMFSHIALRGAAGKINMQIMKIAANLHILEGEAEFNYNISDDNVVSAVAICDELLKANLTLCRHKGIVGVKAEFTAILKYLTMRQGARSERDVINSLRSTKPFSDFTGNQSEQIRKILVEMNRQGLLAVGSKVDPIVQTIFYLV